MKKQVIEKPWVDFVGRCSNGIYAEYIIGPDILNAEKKPDLLGVPFLFFGRTRGTVERARERYGVPYLSMEQFEEMKKNMIVEGYVPKKTETIKILGSTYEIGDLASGYVPFSFGAYHEYDEKNKTRVRGIEDYNNLIHHVMPKVIELRKRRGEEVAKDTRLVNRVLAAIRMYEPSSFTPYEPVARL